MERKITIFQRLRSYLWVLCPTNFSNILLIEVQEYKNNNLLFYYQLQIKGGQITNMKFFNSIVLPHVAKEYMAVKCCDIVAKILSKNIDQDLC